jgi:hypothetical protein
MRQASIYYTTCAFEQLNLFFSNTEAVLCLNFKAYFDAFSGKINQAVKKIYLNLKILSKLKFTAEYVIYTGVKMQIQNCSRYQYIIFHHLDLNTSIRLQILFVFIIYLRYCNSCFCIFY